jgi:hypothetical protein
LEGEPRGEAAAREPGNNVLVPRSGNANIFFSYEGSLYRDLREKRKGRPVEIATQERDHSG